MATMMTVKSISKETGLSEHAVRNYVKQGTLPHIRVGNSQKAKIMLDLDIVLQTLKKLQQQKVLPKINSNSFRLFCKDNATSLPLHSKNVIVGYMSESILASLYRI